MCGLCPGPTGTSAPKKHLMWFKNMGAESSHPRLESSFLMCGSFLCIILLADQSSNPVLFKLSSFQVVSFSLS